MQADRRAAYDAREHANAHLRGLGARHALGRVSLGHVRHLVAHDGRELRVVLRDRKQPLVDADLAARQHEGVDWLLVEDRELPFVARGLALELADDRVGNAGHELDGRPVLHERDLGAHLLEGRGTLGIEVGIGNHRGAA